jgi:hypothetical protein
MLIAAMVGVETRSTMDPITTMKEHYHGYSVFAKIAPFFIADMNCGSISKAGSSSIARNPI